MNRSYFLLFLMGLIGGALFVGEAAEPIQRVANTSLQMPDALPITGYATEKAFGNLDFKSPTAIVTPPGETNRIFIVEQAGRISVITNLAAPTRTVFLDIVKRVTFGGEQGLLGLAFHPGYATNRFFYVFYTGVTKTSVGTGVHDRLSRFEISPSDPNQAIAESELPLLAQFDEQSNHNGGDLHFGADGYLYVGLGDEGGANDSSFNSQRIDKDFFSGILRLDVDNRPGNLPPNAHPSSTTNYSVPADNPFVGTATFNGAPVVPAKVRTEFWAVGLRNPWRFSFDPTTGLLYCGDVGQDRVEEIDIVTKGGNYGWNYREGNISGYRQAPASLSFVEPIFSYTHVGQAGNLPGGAQTQGNSVTGGVVYRGARLPELVGAYLFGDYVSGNLWALRYDGTNTTFLGRLATLPGISAFGTDPANGDVLICAYDQNTIRRLVRATNNVSRTLPETLAETGAFADLEKLTPNPGIIPYDINVHFWSDNARKQRWFSVPDPTRKIGFSADANWSFPNGAVWIKHFDLELTDASPRPPVGLKRACSCATPTAFMASRIVGATRSPTRRSCRSWGWTNLSRSATTESCARKSGIIRVAANA